MIKLTHDDADCTANYALAEAVADFFNNQITLGELDAACEEWLNRNPE